MYFKSILSIFNCFWFIISVVAFTSCSRYPADVERALKLAGDNRTELEQVLEHYRNQPGYELKYRAAEYLIGNMPGKYSEDNKPTEVYQPLFDNWHQLCNEQVIVNRQATFDSLVFKYHLASARRVLPDVEHIKAGYLIDNIELAFEVWTGQPWGKDIPFDVFCEEILPYRISTEPLENWRSLVMEQYRALYDSLRSSNMDAVSACSKVLESIDNRWYQPALKISLPKPSYSMIERFRTGACLEYVTLGTFVMRSLGIPVTWDFTPQWPSRGLGHDWNTVRDENGKHTPFVFLETKPGEPHHAGYPMAKAFRHTYGKQPESLACIAHKEKLPAFFQNPCLLDVSSENFTGADARISLKPRQTKDKYAYLAVFDNRNWVPIQWGKCEDATVFTCMGKNIVYLPLYSRKGDLYYGMPPFLFTQQGTIRWLEADTTRWQTLRLRRKYPVMIQKWLVERMKGGQFQAANRADFSDAVLLHTITDHPDMYFHDVAVDHPGKYRYYRYLSPNGGACNIAELEFYGDGGNTKVTGQIIGTSGSYDNDPWRTLDKAFDGDVLTFYDAASMDGAWVGMDFGKGTVISRIRYLPRNDDNTIVPGQTYELFYFGVNGWISLGKQVASDDTLYYDNAPVNALFWLRNLTKGVEERIFTYENGEQVWW